MLDAPWSATEAPAPGRAELARDLALTLGTALGGDLQTCLARMPLVTPRVLELGRALLGRENDFRLDGGGMVGGIVFGAGDQDPGFQGFLARMAAHRVSALVFKKTFGERDVDLLLEGLIRPAELVEAAGGLKACLERGGATGIQVWPVAIPDTGGDHPPALVRAVRQVLLASLAPPDSYTWGAAGWLHYVADLREAGLLATELGLEGEEPPEAAVRVLRHVFGQLSSDQIVSIGRGLGTLPAHPPALTLAFQRVLPEVLPYVLNQLLDWGHPWMLIAHPVEDLVHAFPGRLAALAEPLRTGLARLGSDPLVQRFLEDVDWRSKNLQAQLKLTESAEVFLHLEPPAQQQLIDQAARAYRLEAVTRLLGHLGDAITSGHPARLSAMEGLRLFLLAADHAAVPDYMIQSLELLLVHAYEQGGGHDTRKGLQALIPAYVRVRLKRGQALGLERVIRALERAEGAPESVSNEGLSVGWLRRYLETDEALDEALACVFIGERGLALDACAPFYACLGEPLYHRAAWRLGRESDRQSRERLIRVLIGAGSGVEELLLRMLRPNMPWYHARNLLLVLAHVGTHRALTQLPSFLDHADLRVRSMALRALRACSRGRAPVAWLVARLEDPDEGVRQEAISMLAQLPTRDTVKALTSMAEDRRVPVVTRLAAVQGLAATGLAEARAALQALASQPSGFLKRAENEQIRRAASHALLQR